MKLKELQALIKDFEDSELTLLELETEDVKLKLAKIDPNQIGHTNNSQLVEKLNTQLEITDKNEQTSQLIPNLTEPKLPRTAVRSPLVGTFYAAPSPEAEPFVKSGDRIKKGQIIGIVEAMKIMNEITSTHDGVVDEVTAVNGNVIGFDEVVMWLRDSNNE